MKTNIDHLKKYLTDNIKMKVDCNTIKIPIQTTPVNYNSSNLWNEMDINQRNSLITDLEQTFNRSIKLKFMLFPKQINMSYWLVHML